jgi:hypothetical protein
MKNVEFATIGVDVFANVITLLVFCDQVYPGVHVACATEALRRIAGERASRNLVIVFMVFRFYVIVHCNVTAANWINKVEYLNFLPVQNQKFCPRPYLNAGKSE